MNVKDEVDAFLDTTPVALAWSIWWKATMPVPMTQIQRARLHLLDIEIAEALDKDYQMSGLTPPNFSP